jgi:hypothetical protein
LIHEDYWRLIKQRETNWQDREQFFAVAAQKMGRILLDHARACMQRSALEVWKGFLTKN